MDFREFRNKYMFKPPEHVKHKVSSRPLVSICVQTYQHVNYIEQCLDSLLEQKTDFEYEILLGEDNSSDGTRELCIEYAQKFPERIRLFLHHEDNKIKVRNIPTGNFNAFYNFYQARGKYIAFCEGDDFWTDPEKLQMQTDFLKQQRGYSLCFHKFEEHFSHNYSGKFYALEQPLWDISARDLRTLKFHPLLSTVCFKSQTIKELPEEMIKVINVDSFLLSLLGTLGSAKFHAMIKPTIYRRHDKGVWSGKLKESKLELKINTFKKIEDYYRKNNNTSLALFFSRKLRNKYRSLFLFYVRENRFKRAFKLLPRII